MLTALCFGKDALEYKKIEVEMQVKSKKKKKKFVFEVSDESNIEHKRFVIGHKMKSQTFLPEFMDKDIGGIIFGDVAGFNDSHGDLISFVNSFLLK